MGENIRKLLQQMYQSNEKRKLYYLILLFIVVLRPLKLKSRGRILTNKIHRSFSSSYIFVSAVCVSVCAWCGRNIFSAFNSIIMCIKLLPSLPISAFSIINPHKTLPEKRLLAHKRIWWLISLYLSQKFITCLISFGSKFF